MTALFSTLPPLAPADTDVIGGRYEVLRPIARGGMGEVLETRHLYSARVTAVKVARRELGDRSDVRERLRREAKALAACRHPHILALLDAGTCKKRGPYLVTEKLHGRSLDGLLASRSSLGVGGAVQVLRQMAEALGEVHRRGFVHRDVKPGNIFVSSTAGVERIKLIDFGIVAPNDPSHGLAGHGLTVAGEILGSLGYIAPEQLDHASRANARSDLYSLAVVVLECLGGMAPDLSTRMTTEQLASSVLAGRDDVPAALIELLDAMLAIDPARRPADAADVLARLGEAIPGPIDTRPLLGGYGPAVQGRDEPTLCEPARRRAVATESRRRTTGRAPYGTPMMILHASGSMVGRVEDISSGGLLAVTTGCGDESLEDVRVRFALPTTGAVVTISCDVRWARKSPGRTAMGMSFRALPPDFAAAIATYVEWHVRWLVVCG
jgi:tRNA A-37 threonylcarbamoyl transferase component Bud32